MLTSPRRSISYPNPDRSDRPDIPLHIGNVVVAADGDVLYDQGTSTARSAATHQTDGGRIWFETDTGLLVYDDGTNWTKISLDPSGSYTYTGSASQLSFSGQSSAGNIVLRSKLTGDSQYRYNVGADGKITWGSGSLATDTTLYRNGVGLLKTDGSFDANSYKVAGVALASTHLSDSSSLARLASPTFTGILTAPDVYVIDTLANTPSIKISASDAGADSKNWRFRVDGTKLYCEVFNDAGTVFASWVEVTRTGAGISTVNFPYSLLSNGKNVQAGQLVAARIASDGTPSGGVTSVTHSGTGVYVVNFNVAFSALPVVQITLVGANGTYYITPATGSVTVHTFNAAGAAADIAFHVVARENVNF